LKVLNVLEKMVPLKSKKKRSRLKMHRMRRLLWRRLAKARKNFQSACSIHKLTEYMQQMWELESQLSADYTDTTYKEEDEAVLRIK
jgi:predicted nucleic acid-binding protein